MIASALVQVQRSDRPLVEAVAVESVLTARGVPVQRYTLKRLLRRQLPLGPSVLLTGDMEAVPIALRQLGVGQAPLGSYPATVRPFLRRRIERSTLGESFAAVERGERLFVKPAERAKGFTGFVCESYTDFSNAAGCSRRLPVWVAEPVRFISEWRAYVVEGEPRAVAQYRGESEQAPLSFVVEVLSAVRERGLVAAGFALDVGRLSCGRLAVVECNEGYGLGLYPGCPHEVYVDLLLARWTELMAAAVSHSNHR